MPALRTVPLTSTPTLSARACALVCGSVDVSAAGWRNCRALGGVADRGAQTTWLVTSVTFFRTATGELSERFLDRGDQTPAPPMASVCFGNTAAGRKSARRQRKLPEQAPPESASDHYSNQAHR